MSPAHVSGRFTTLPDDETLAATVVALEERSREPRTDHSHCPRCGQQGRRSAPRLSLRPDPVRPRPGDAGQ
jgi:hypothetical protein